MVEGFIYVAPPTGVALELIGRLILDKTKHQRGPSNILIKVLPGRAKVFKVTQKDRKPADACKNPSAAPISASFGSTFKQVSLVLRLIYFSSLSAVFCEGDSLKT